MWVDFISNCVIISTCIYGYIYEKSKIMKTKTIVSLLAIVILTSCGKSEAEIKAEKQKALSDQFDKDQNALRAKLTADTNQLNRELMIEKAIEGKK